MKLVYIKGQGKLISVAASGISVLLAVLICMKIFSFYKLSTRAANIENMAQIIIANDCNKPDDLKKYLTTTKEMADNLKKSNLFAPPPPKTNPVTQITGIMGSEAWINNKWCKEGEMIQDAKIISIEPTQVTIEWDGKKTVLRPLGVDIASNEPGENAPPRPENIPTSSSRVVTLAPPQREQSPVEPASSPSMVMTEQPSQGQIPEQVKKVMEQMNIQNINPAMIQNISDVEKEQFEKMMRMQMERN